MTTFAARLPAGVTIAPPRGTGAWRTAANSMASPPARLSAPPTPVDIHSDRLAAFTIASTSRSQMSPFQSSMRAKPYPFRSVSVLRPTGPEAAWYTRGSRRDMSVTTSHEFVVRSRARSSTPMRSSPDRPMSTNSSVEVDRRPRDVRHVGHDRVHRDVADERHPPASDERARPVRQRPRPAVAVAERERRDAARARVLKVGP